MEECIHCPAEVKTRLAELKLTRNKQKNQLKAGYHKIFIDRLWERLHGPPLTSDDDDEEDTSWEADHLVSIYHIRYAIITAQYTTGNYHKSTHLERSRQTVDISNSMYIRCVM